MSKDNTPLLLIEKQYDFSAVDAACYDPFYELDAPAFGRLMAANIPLAQ